VLILAVVVSVKLGQPRQPVARRSTVAVRSGSATRS